MLEYWNDGIMEHKFKVHNSKLAEFMEIKKALNLSGLFCISYNRY